MKKYELKAGDNLSQLDHLLEKPLYFYKIEDNLIDDEGILYKCPKTSEYFLFQNKVDGEIPDNWSKLRDKFGYKYSWTLYQFDLDRNQTYCDFSFEVKELELSHNLIVGQWYKSEYWDFGKSYARFKKLEDNKIYFDLAYNKIESKVQKDNWWFLNPDVIHVSEEEVLKNCPQLSEYITIKSKLESSSYKPGDWVIVHNPENDLGNGFKRNETYVRQLLEKGSITSSVSGRLDEKAEAHEIPKTETPKIESMDEDKFDSLFEDKPIFKFKIGDRVKAINGISEKYIGYEGTVVSVNPFSIGVVFDKYIEGHTLDSKCKDGCGWWLDENCLIHIDSIKQHPVKSSECFSSKDPVSILNAYEQTPVVYSGKRNKRKLVTIFN